MGRVGKATKGRGSPRFCKSNTASTINRDFGTRASPENACIARLQTGWFLRKLSTSRSKIWVYHFSCNGKLATAKKKIKNLTFRPLALRKSDKSKCSFSLPHRSSTTVSLEKEPLLHPDRTGLRHFRNFFVELRKLKKRGEIRMENYMTFLFPRLPSYITPVPCYGGYTKKRRDQVR